jgi:hypothetical protein
MRSPTVAVALGIGLVLLPSCGKSVFRSAEGQFCSTDDGDDPFYECLLGMSLICANTHSISVPTDNGGVRFQPVYLCRVSCAPGDFCRQAGDVCCPSKTYGRTYEGRPYACVPEVYCDNGDSDAGTVDAGPPKDARRATDSSGDGDDDGGDGAPASTDATPADGGVAGDASADAPTDAPADAAVDAPADVAIDQAVADVSADSAPDAGTTAD